MSGVAVVCYWAAYLGAWPVLTQARIGRPLSWRDRAWSISLWCAVAIPSTLQFAFPVLYDQGQRQPEAIRDGQVWRLVTSMFVQDGGRPGAILSS